MRIAIYIRAQHDDTMHTKTAAQLFHLYAHAANNGYKLSLKHVYTDMGSANASSRPGLDKLLRDAATKQFQKVLITGHDRLARSFPAMTKISDTLKHNSVSIEVAG